MFTYQGESLVRKDIAGHCGRKRRKTRLSGWANQFCPEWLRLLLIGDGESEKTRGHYFLNGRDRLVVSDSVRPSSDGRGRDEKGKMLSFETAKMRTCLGR